MAKAAWCTVAPTTGDGNKTVAISATAHTGRAARSTTVTVQNQNGTKPSKAITVNQEAKPEFVTLTTKEVSLPASGGTASITGVSNKARICISEEGDRWLDNALLKVNSVVQPQDPNAGGEFPITNNLGTAEQYNFELVITIPANTYAGIDTFQYYIEGTSSYLKITQAGAVSALSTDKASLSLANAGTVQNVGITSNDKWTIS